MMRTVLYNRGGFIFENKRRDKYLIYTIKNHDGKIIAIRSCEDNVLSELRIGDEVVSNGKSWIGSGTTGKVIGFNKPGANGSHSEIIQVVWKGNEFKSDMKYKDLDCNMLFDMNRQRILTPA